VEEGALGALWSATVASDFTAIHGELAGIQADKFPWACLPKKVIIKSCGRYCPKANFEWNCPTEIVAVDVELRYFSFLQSGKEGA
jgi:hypothetical protein